MAATACSARDVREEPDDLDDFSGSLSVPSELSDLADRSKMSSPAAGGRARRSSHGSDSDSVEDRTISHPDHVSPTRPKPPSADRGSSRADGDEVEEDIVHDETGEEAAGSSSASTVSDDDGDVAAKRAALREVPGNLAAACAAAAERAITEFMESLAEERRLGEVGSPSDDDLAALDDTRCALRHCKRAAIAAAAELVAAGGKPIPPGDPVEGEGWSEESAWHALLRHCVTSGDRWAPFLGHIVAGVRADWIGFIGTAGLLPIACADGNPAVFAALLAILAGNAEAARENCDFVEAFASATFSHTRRVALVTALLDAPKGLLPWRRMGDDVAEFAQSHLEAITNKAARHLHEIQDGRVEHVQRLLSPTCPVRPDPCRVGPDDLTPAARAARADDVEMLEGLRRFAPQALATPLPGGFTLLTQATFFGAANAAEWLVRVLRVDPRHRTPDGTALEIATVAGHKRIVDLLRAAHGGGA